jgi:hypothetical protein
VIDETLAAVNFKPSTSKSNGTASNATEAHARG